MAEYLGALIYAASGKDAAEQAQRMKDALDPWRNLTRSYKKSVSIAQAAYLEGREFDDYGPLLYAKGPLVVHMLRTMLGNERFFALLKTILTKYGDQNIETEHFAREVSAVAGQDMKWFFDQWILEPGVPEVEVSKSVVQEGGKPMLTGRLRQRDPANFKRLLVPFVFELPGGQRGVKLVMMDKPDMEFRVELPPGASGVTVDPSNNNLAIYL
jgi:aminopeptidase N